MAWGPEHEAWWQQLSEEVMTGRRDWRAAHPRATFAEIEAVVDERLNGMRARMLADVALASAAAEEAGALPGPCPACGERLQRRGTQTRTLTIQGDQPVHLGRPYAVCPAGGTELFPLDGELTLRPGRYSPYVQQWIVRLGTWLPFEQVPGALAWFTRVPVGRETARRLTERAGAALVTQETARVEQLEQRRPPPGAPPTLHQLSVDGAMVPLVHGEGAEVKTLAIGRVVQRGGEAHATERSYLSRLTDADTFRRLAWVETHRRGIPLAPRVCAVVDGAEWCQAFITRHCPDAVRILDFPHAAGYVSAAAQAMFGPGTAEASAWLGPQLPTRKYADPAAGVTGLAPEWWLWYRFGDAIRWRGSACGAGRS